MLPYSVIRYVGDTELSSSCHDLPLPALRRDQSQGLFVGGGLGSLGEVVVNKGHREMEDK